MTAKFRMGDKVRKRNGYEYPGFIVSVFTNRAGAVRYVVEADHPAFSGMLNIFNEEQLELRESSGQESPDAARRSRRAPRSRPAAQIQTETLPARCRACEQAATRSTSPLAARDPPIGRAAQSVESYLALIDIKTAGPPPETTRIALSAFDRCGKGRRPAQLNFGDRFALYSRPRSRRAVDVQGRRCSSERYRSRPRPSGPVRSSQDVVRGQSPILAGEPAAVG
jgi:uncharacterized protein with PIN domain